MSTKNTIIEHLVKSLLEQRSSLIKDLTYINYNESTSFTKKEAIEKSIVDIDNQINSHIINLELTK